MGILRNVASVFVTEVIKMCCRSKFKLDTGTSVTLTKQNSSGWINVSGYDACIYTHIHTHTLAVM